MKIDLPKNARIIVVGDIHEHLEHFEKFINTIQPTTKDIVVSVGDVYDKGFGAEEAEIITDQLKSLASQRKAFAVKGNHELIHLLRSKKNKKLSKQLKWWKKQPLAITFVFPNRTKVLVVHGGVLPSHKSSDLTSDVDVCYIRYIDKDGKKVKRIKKIKDGMLFMEAAKEGQLWHDLYDGRFGYIASGHNAQKDGVPKFYNYSCNLDTAVYHTGKLTAQTFERGLRKELITISGRPKYPDLDEMRRMMAQVEI